MTAYVNVDGETCLSATLHVPNVGPWWATVVFEGAPDVSGAVVLSLGSLELSGFVDPTHDGTRGNQRTSRIVAGGNGWATLLASQAYHNDAGVRALAVVQDAARLAGETLGDFQPANATIGIDYVRQAGRAARVLEEAIGGAAWWVAYDGTTQVGERPTSEADVADYEVLDHDPASNLATLAIDDLTTVGIGSILSEGLDAPLTVRELEIQVSADTSRTLAWGGGTDAGRGRLAGIVRSLVQRSTDDRLFGKYRYRVVAMSGVRVELQAVAVAAGLPDVVPVSMRPGVAGAHASLTGGSIVLLEFIEGDRTMPIVVGFAGKDEEGDAPAELDFSVATTLRLGSDGASEGVTLGDSHKSWADGHTHAYVDSVGQPVVATPSLTSAPSAAVSGIPLDPSPATSSKVFVE